MTPVNIDGCFGWLHLPKKKQTNIAVVLCPGVKTDELTGYRSLRVLAEALAEQGHPVLRLHYTHTGDSVEIGGDADFWPTWQNDIHRAVDWLKQQCNVADVALCGLRFGAMLASVVAAKRDDVCALMLLAPVLRGRTYMRQLRSDGYYEVGARFSARDIEAINNLDLKTVIPRIGCKVLMLAQSTSSLSVTDFVDSWRIGGADMKVAEFSGLEPMLHPTFANHEAEPVIKPIITWLGESCPPVMKAVSTPDLPPVEIRHAQWHEQPLMFGTDLFGILCRPVVETNRTIVVMANSSADPHCAINSVGLARHLAIKGIATLRMDFAGVGDSESSDKHGSHVFEINRNHDMSAAIDALQQLGYNQFAAEGLCSGAYHAYHATMADPRIDYALLINLPFFDWVVGFPVEDLVFHARKPSHLLREMRTKTFWLTQWNKIAQGDLRIIRNRFVWLQRKLRHVPGWCNQPTQHSARHVKMLFLVSEGDVSGDILQREFGSRMLPGMKVELVDGLDHTMQRPNMCAVVANRISLFVEEKCALPTFSVLDTEAQATPALVGGN
jgi:alpha/beta superfamily hydrolase